MVVCRIGWNHWQAVLRREIFVWAVSGPSIRLLDSVIKTAQTICASVLIDGLDDNIVNSIGDIGSIFQILTHRKICGWSAGWQCQFLSSEELGKRWRDGGDEEGIIQSGVVGEGDRVSVKSSPSLLLNFKNRAEASSLSFLPPLSAEE